MYNERQRCEVCNNSYADALQNGKAYCSPCYLETFSEKHKKKAEEKVSREPVMGLHGEILH